MRTVFDAPDATFEVDEETSIFSFKWKGTVSEASVKRIMTIASKACAIMDQAHWFIDRTEMEGYSPEARIWMKTKFMNVVGTDLIQKTDKIAAVNSSSPMAEISSSVLIDAIRALNDKIEYQEFDVSLPALNWLKGDAEKAPEPEVKKKKGFFSRK